MCVRLDEALFLRASPNVTYTRYADDLFFSASKPNLLGAFPTIVQEVLASLPYPVGLKVNAAKTRHSSLKRRRRVTGLILSSQGVISTGRSFKRRVRTLVHRVDELSFRDRAILAGLIAFIRDVEPQFFNRLVIKYGEGAIRAAKMPMPPG
jgi:RNA-directed DNA polymerase